ncbi:hypothetical protein Tco_0659136 [Tanacetum coccineum]
MANQEQNPPQQEQPFVVAKQVGFNLEDIILNINNEICFSVPIGGIYGEVGVNTFRNDIGAHYLPHSREYVAPLSIDIVRQWFKTIGYGETVPVKGTLKKSLLPPKRRLLMARIIQCLGDIIIKLNKRHKEKVVPYTRFLLMMHNMKEGYRDGELSQWYLKLPSPLPMLRGLPIIKPGAKPGHKKHSTSSKQPSVSSKEATIASTLVVAEMHKEDQQATGGPTSLGVTSEARANPHSVEMMLYQFPQLKPILENILSNFVPQQQSMNDGTKNTSYDHLFTGTGPYVLADKTQSVKEDEALRTIKLEDLAKLVSSVQPNFKDLDSLKDDPIIVVDGSDEDEEADEVRATKNSQKHKLELEKNKAKAEAALLKAQPSFPNVRQLNEIMVKSLKTEFSKVLSAHDFSSSLPIELKDLPSKFNELTEEVKGLKKQVHELDIELLGDLKEIPSKLEDFTKTVTIEMVQAKLKTLDALPSLLNKVTNALNQFAQAITSKKTRDTNVPLAGQASTQPTEGVKNTDPTTIS